jgi:hypothetical protein
VYVRLQNKTDMQFPVWTGPRANVLLKGWRVAQVPLISGLVDTEFQVVFEVYVPSRVATGSNDYQIFLDDVFIRAESCLPAGDCDFENGLCTWQTDEATVSQGGQWLIGDGTSSDRLRPTADHT